MKNKKNKKNTKIEKIEKQLIEGDLLLALIIFIFFNVLALKYDNTLFNVISVIPGIYIFMGFIACFQSGEE